MLIFLVALAILQTFVLIILGTNVLVLKRQILLSQKMEKELLKKQKEEEYLDKELTHIRAEISCEKDALHDMNEKITALREEMQSKVDIISKLKGEE